VLRAAARRLLRCPATFLAMLSCVLRTAELPAAHGCSGSQCCTSEWSWGVLGSALALPRRPRPRPASARLARRGCRAPAGGAQLRVAPSQSKHKLYVGNLPKDMSKEDLQATLAPLVKGARPPRPAAARSCAHRKAVSCVVLQARHRLCACVQSGRCCTLARGLQAGRARALSAGPPSKCAGRRRRAHRAAHEQGGAGPEPRLRLCGVLQPHLRERGQGRPERALVQARAGRTAPSRLLSWNAPGKPV